VKKAKSKALGEKDRAMGGLKRSENGKQKEGS